MNINSNFNSLLDDKKIKAYRNNINHIQHIVTHVIMS